MKRLIVYRPPHLKFSTNTLSLKVNLLSLKNVLFVAKLAPDLHLDTQMVQSSRLLQLPGELRNKIYEYAFTEEHGLIAYSGSLGCLRTFGRGPARESHQLKYLCHWLYTETRDLALRYNKLTFCGPGSWGGLSMLYVLLFHNTSPSCLKGVVRIHIETCPKCGGKESPL